MRPSAVRTRILSDHEMIRATVSEVESIAHRILDGELGLSSHFRQGGSYLYMQLCRHLSLEDSILVAALRDIASSGRELADDLEVEHREQRELLDYLLERLDDESQPTALLIQDFLGFTSLLRDDMSAEEANLLNNGLLSDDRETVEPLVGSR